MGTDVTFSVEVLLGLTSTQMLVKQIDVLLARTYTKNTKIESSNESTLCQAYQNQMW